MDSLIQLRTKYLKILESHHTLRNNKENRIINEVEEIIPTCNDDSFLSDDLQKSTLPILDSLFFVLVLKSLQPNFFNN